MTTLRQVKRLVRPLLEKHIELVVVGRMIVLPPVGHVLRAVYIDRTGRAERFQPRWTVMHLFERCHGPWFNLGGDIYKVRPTPWHPEFPSLWWIEDPDTPQALIEAVEKSVLPKLEGLHDIEAYYRHLTSVRDHAYHLRPYQSVIVEAARGNLDKVRAICRNELSRYPDDTFGNRPEEIDLIRLPKQICACLETDDRAGIAALLHEWERATVRNLKIEHLWQETPFPLEEMPHG